MKHRLDRMLKEAAARRNDADILSASLHKQSDADAFLRILAFEVLLKAAVLASGCPKASSHDYKGLWDALPSDVQDEVLAVARDRMPGHSDLTDLEKLLHWFRFVFVKARYGYELHEGMTPQEVSDKGRSWEERGSLVEDAEIQYYPNELECLSEGLATYVAKAL